MTLLLAASVLVGVVVSEIARRALGSTWLRQGLRDSDARLRSFRAAGTDAERQRLILQAGFTLLRVSLSVLAVSGLLLAVVGVVPWASHASGSEQTAFYVAVSLCAIAWSTARARHARPDAHSPSVPQELR